MSFQLTTLSHIEAAVLTFIITTNQRLRVLFKYIFYASLLIDLLMFLLSPDNNARQLFIKFQKHRSTINLS